VKYLVLLAILALVVLLFFGRGRGKSTRQRPPPPAGSPFPSAPSSAPSAPAPPGEMLACAHCGVHLPRSEVAFNIDGQPYCSPEHRVAGPR
jgi:uncharacterized protein